MADLLVEQERSENAPLNGQDSEIPISNGGGGSIGPIYNNQNNKDKVQAGIFHMAALALATIIIVPLALRAPQLSAENICGFAFLAEFLLYLAHIWYLFCKAPNLYRIETVSYIPSDWAPMSIAQHQVLHDGNNKKYPLYPITSISGFSAIAGGVAKMLLARVGTMTWGILMALIAVQITNHDIEFRRSMILECVGAFGMNMIGTFYDDGHSKGMVCGHTLGVLCLSCCLAGFWWQRLYDIPEKNSNERNLWFPGLLTVGSVTFIILWMCLTICKCFPLPKNPTKIAVTHRSLVLLMFETLGLGSLTFAFCFYFILYPKNME